MKYKRVRNLIRISGSISLLLFPAALMLAFALHFETLSEFFVFKIKYVPSTASAFMNTLTSAKSNRLYVIPHLIGYIGLPLLISTALVLASILFRSKPWYALIGASLSCIGSVFMGGVFGSWLSFSAISRLPVNQIEGAIPVLQVLTEMKGALFLTSIMSAFSLLGLMILAIGLFHSKILPKWSSSLIFLGNLIILIFMDLDNLMFIGAFLMFLGMLPISLSLLKCDNNNQVFREWIGN